MDIELPPLLMRLLADGTWRTDGQIDRRISAELARSWDPLALGIHFVAPRLLADDIRAVPELADLWNVVDVDPELCVVIAEFSLGCDNAIVLDFRQNPAPVRTQQWSAGETEPATWIPLADSFDDFVEMLGLV